MFPFSSFFQQTTRHTSVGTRRRRTRAWDGRERKRMLQLHGFKVKGHEPRKPAPLSLSVQMDLCQVRRFNQRSFVSSLSRASSFHQVLRRRGGGTQFRVAKNGRPAMKLYSCTSIKRRERKKKERKKEKKKKRRAGCRQLCAVGFE